MTSVYILSIKPDIAFLNEYMNLIAERSEASNPGRTTEMGVVLYGLHRASGIYIYIYISDCICTISNLHVFSSKRYTVSVSISIETSAKRKIRIQSAHPGPRNKDCT